MGKVCVAPGCKSGYKPKGNEGKKRRFHMFPKMSPYANSGQRLFRKKIGYLQDILRCLTYISCPPIISQSLLTLIHH
ncbi:Putative LOC100212901, partial [Caligus rogercresseyi]